jgi:hypothetical protein
MSSDDTASRLVALPDHCLLAVMQCCADDTHSMLSAATAHSRLQRAAVAALSTISAGQLGYARVESFLLYLAKHGKYVRSLVLRAPMSWQPLKLPPSLTKLDSLQLANTTLQLQPDVLRAEFPLTRLELSSCTLLDGAQGLEAALAQLPDLQHLSVENVFHESAYEVFPTAVLSYLTNLTCLALRVEAGSSRDISAALGSLQALTRLADLELYSFSEGFCRVNVDMLSGASQLTRLVLFHQCFEPRALTGKTQLQHLSLRACSFAAEAGVSQLLSELQHLTQLTHLDLTRSCRLMAAAEGGHSPPSTAYASLTASSRLQHLDLSGLTLPSAAWQYMCPPGRTLPQLQYLNIRHVQEADRSAVVPNTSALVSCCPGLQTLLSSMPCSTAQLEPLQRLTGLRNLALGSLNRGDADFEGVQVLCQLTGLQELELSGAHSSTAQMLQLTRLTGLTALFFQQFYTSQDFRCRGQVS